MKVEILDYTKNPLTKIGEMASICYNTELKDEEHAKRIAKHCLNSQHMRNLEFARVTLKITCSARVGRELYTHLGGSPTRLQASTRYITYDDFDYYTPDFSDCMIEEEYHDLMMVIKDFYKLMKDKGIDNDITGYILPLAMETTIVWEGNARTLQNLMNQRLCYRVLDEFRYLAKAIKSQIRALDDEWKWISDSLFVPKCISLGYCPEKKKDCILYREKN